MKKTKALLLVIILILLALPFAACDKGGDSFNSGMLKNCSLNLSDVSSLGIINRAKQSNVSNTKTDLKLAGGSGNTENKNYLTLFDDDENQTEAVFERGNKQIFQDDLPAQIDHFYVTGDFIFLRFAKNDFFGGYVYEAEDMRYISDEIRQCYVIYKPTGKIYSLENFNISKIAGNFILNDRIAYEISVENNELKFASLTNAPIHIADIIVDKFGQVFVSNEVMEGRESINGREFFFYKEGLNSEKVLRKGDDGYVYSLFRLNESRVTTVELLSLKRYDENFILSALPASIDTKIYMNNYYYTNICFINNDKVYYSYGTSIIESYIFEQKNGKIFYCTIEDTFAAENGIGVLPSEIGNEISLTSSATWIAVHVPSRLTVMSQLLNGALTYIIYIENDELVVVLEGEITYTQEIITIKPLN